MPISRTTTVKSPAATLLPSLTLCGLLAAGCAYTGPASGLLDQRAQWFSYVDAGDIRTACEPGTLDRYRFIYNADFNRQARAYDVIEQGDGAVLRQTIDRGVTLATDRLSLGEVLQPVSEAVILEDAQVVRLQAAMEESALYDGAPVGLRLEATDYYWIAAGCRDGVFFYDALQWPSDAWDRFTVDAVLAEWDTTGVRWPEPRPQRGLDPCRRQGNDTDGVCFTLEIGADGLAGRQGLL